MGILKPHIHILCMEQKKHPIIKGDVLTLGQQAVYSTISDVKTILTLYNVQLKELPSGFNTATKIPHWKGTPHYGKYTNAQSLFTMLGADNVYVTDVSTYEDPDFIINLNDPVEDSYYEKFDTIVDVGTMEHIFDISIALDNISKMLKRGGNVVMILPCSNCIDHGFYSFSPTLFFDYFGANGFSNMSCYLREGSPYNCEKKGRLFRYNYVGKEIPLISCQAIEVAFLATKNKKYNPNYTVKPIQSIYRQSESWNTTMETQRSTGGFVSRGGGSLRGKIKEFLRRILYYTRNFSPVFVDKLIFGWIRGKNLKYLGKY